MTDHDVKALASTLHLVAIVCLVAGALVLRRKRNGWAWVAGLVAATAGAVLIAASVVLDPDPFGVVLVGVIGWQAPAIVKPLAMIIRAARSKDTPTTEPASTRSTGSQEPPLPRLLTETPSEVVLLAQGIGNSENAAADVFRMWELLYGQTWDYSRPFAEAVAEVTVAMAALGDDANRPDPP